MLTSSPFLLAPRRLCPSSMRPHSICVHAKTRTRNQQTSNGKKKMCRYCAKGTKQTSKIDMASIAYGRRHDEPQDKQANKEAIKQTGKQANKKEDKQVKRQTKRWCPQGTNVGLD